jgi:hypothetical protein
MTAVGLDEAPFAGMGGKEEHAPIQVIRVLMTVGSNPPIKGHSWPRQRMVRAVSKRAFGFAVEPPVIK